jgi:hypothetical protein
MAASGMAPAGPPMPLSYQARNAPSKKAGRWQKEEGKRQRAGQAEHLENLPVARAPHGEEPDGAEDEQQAVAAKRMQDCLQQSLLAEPAPKRKRRGCAQREEKRRHDEVGHREPRAGGMLHPRGKKAELHARVDGEHQEHGEAAQVVQGRPPIGSLIHDGPTVSRSGEALKKPARKAPCHSSGTRLISSYPAGSWVPTVPTSMYSRRMGW